MINLLNARWQQGIEIHDKKETQQSWVLVVPQESPEVDLIKHGHSCPHPSRDFSKLDVIKSLQQMVAKRFLYNLHLQVRKFL